MSARVVVNLEAYRRATAAIQQAQDTFTDVSAALAAGVAVDAAAPLVVAGELRSIANGWAESDSDVLFAIRRRADDLDGGEQP